MSWTCECGFTNKPQNEICGGKGPMGCNAPSPGVSSFAPMKGKGKGKSIGYGSTPYGSAMNSPYGGMKGPMGGGFGSGMAMKGGFGGGMGMKGMGMNSPYGGQSDYQWACPCGFMNKPTNEVCGGTGPVGCKAPKHVAGWAMAKGCMAKGMMGAGMMGGMKGGFGGDGMKGGGMLGPMGGGGMKGMMMGGGMKGGMKGGGKAGEWTCGECNFKNRPTNQVCGGEGGTMGCKAERIIEAPVMMSKGKGKSGKENGPGGWVCDGCGFKNRASNQVCGGEGGTMGCKEPMGEGVVPNAGPTRSTGGEDWLCECGFVNKPLNKVCGGTGPAGCKMERSIGEALGGDANGELED